MNFKERVKQYLRESKKTRRPETNSKGQIKCEQCKKFYNKKEMRFAIDPYREEFDDNVTEDDAEWICSDCWDHSVGSI
jgi:hypothetical protein